MWSVHRDCLGRQWDAQAPAAAVAPLDDMATWVVRPAATAWGHALQGIRVPRAVRQLLPLRTFVGWGSTLLEAVAAVHCVQQGSLARHRGCPFLVARVLAWLDMHVQLDRRTRQRLCVALDGTVLGVQELVCRAPVLSDGSVRQDRHQQKACRVLLGRLGVEAVVRAGRV